MAINNAENYENNNTFNFEEYSNEIDNFVFNWTLSTLDENNTENNVTTEWKESSEYDKYPYINEQDYKKYFAPETYNFKHLGIWSCRFVSSIYWITQMESYKQLVKNSVKKDTDGNFIVKIPLSITKDSNWIRHKINISTYQNQLRIDWFNPQILHKEKNDKDQNSWNWIIALAMAIWEEVTKMTKFDINRLDGWDPVEIFLNWKVIQGISIKEKVKNSDIKIDELKQFLSQKDTLIIANVKENNDWIFEAVTWDEDKPNHGVKITKIINKNNREYVQYYDPNFYELKEILVDDFFKICISYDVFSETDNKFKYPPVQKQKSYYDEDDKNSAWIVVENTWKSDETLRNLRWDFITYKEDDKIIVESFGKKAEISDNHELKNDPNTRKKVEEYVKSEYGEDTGIWELMPYRTINFSDTNVYLNINVNKLSNKHKWEKNDKYNVYLYLPKIANFMNRMIYDYIDTEARNKENPSPFSINKIWDLVLDDDPYSVKLDKIENSERTNVEMERKDRRKEKEKPWNHKLVCLRHRSKLWINDKETKEAIVRTLNNMVIEKRDR